MRALVCLGLLLLSSAMTSEPALQFELAEQVWTRNAELVESPPVRGSEDDLLVVLGFDSPGTRWSTTFETEAADTWRLALDWELGPAGLLLEIMIDGEPLPPLRDVWRPSARRQRADLGPRWLGAGQHQIEFIAREATAEDLVVHPELSARRLRLDEPAHHGEVAVQRLILQHP